MIVFEYSDEILLDKINSIERDKQDIEDYKTYLKV